MGSVLSWAANTVLFVAGCFLAADTANDVIASFLTPPPPETATEQRAPAPTRDRTWSNRQIILTRNLFNSSTLDPPPPPEDVTEDIEESKLPLTLLGTFASTDPTLARAAIEQTGQRETFVVGVGDEVADGKATVVRIERRRVVLSENGALRELTLEDPEARVVRTARAPRRPARRPRSVPEVRDLGGDRFAVSREDVEDALRNPTNLLTQARILPKFEDGQMVGLQVSGIKEGSLFEDFGFEEGDVITEFAGLPIDNPNDGVKILQKFNEGGEFSVTVLSPDGTLSEKNILPE